MQLHRSAERSIAMPVSETCCASQEPLRAPAIAGSARLGMPTMKDDQRAVHAYLHGLQAARDQLLGRGEIMNSREERQAVKRAASIGEYRRENDLNQNEFKVTTYIHIDGNKYFVTGSDGQFCTWVPGGAVCDETLENLREKVIAHLNRPTAKEDAGVVVATCEWNRRVIAGDRLTVSFYVGMVVTKLDSKPFDRDQYVGRVEVVMTKSGEYELRY